MVKRHRRSHALGGRLMESLEARKLLTTWDFGDIDADTIRVTINGPGALTEALPTPTGRTLSVTGTTSLSTLTVQILNGAGNNQFVLNSLVVNGNIGEITLQNLVTLQADPSQSAFAGIQVTGKARKITVNGTIIRSDIEIEGSGQDNRTEIRLKNAFGNDLSDVVGFQGTTDRVRVTSGGAITYFEANDVNLLTVQARWMTDVRIHNNVPGLSRGPGVPGSDIDIVATDAGVPWGVKTIVIDGAVSFGDWFMNSPVQSILIGTVGFAQEPPNRGFFGDLNIDVNGRLGTLRATNGDLFGNFGAASFGLVTATDEIGADIGGFGTGGSIPPRGQPNTASIDSLRADEINSTTVHVSGGLKQLNVGSMFSADFDLGWLGVGTVSGGGMNGVNFTLLTPNATRSRALDQLTVAGGTSGCTIFAQFNGMGTLAFNGGFIGSRLLAGTNGGADFFNDADPFASSQTIQSVKIKAPLGDGPAFGGPSIIAARTISSFQSTARLADNAGNDFGVVADTLSSVSVRRGNNSIFNSANTSFTDPDSNVFRIRVI